MKAVISHLVFSASIVVLTSSGCKQSESPKANPQADSPKVQPSVASAPTHAPAHAATGPGSKGVVASGAVLETINSGGYTYVLLDSAMGKIWAVGPQASVTVGQTLSFSNGMPMAGWTSNTLKRTFDMVYFVPGFAGTDAAKQAAPAAATKAPKVLTVAKGKVKGGQTVAEVFAGKAALNGKEVMVRGQVVKFNSGIMGRNWIHLQDGTGTSTASTNDLTFTTDATVKVGETVTIKGTVVLDKDFGGGYKYNVIVENASIIPGK